MKEYGALTLTRKYSEEEINLIVNTLSISLSRFRLVILLVIIKDDKMSVIVIKIGPLKTNDTCFVKQRSAADIDKNYRKKYP
jgi:hypothetical protein